MDVSTNVVLVCLLVAGLANTAFCLESIMGRREPCSNEGEMVNVDSIKDMKCFKCICQNGFVECEKENCPAVDDCYMLEKKKEKSCCERCKACVYKGAVYESGTEWTDPDDPCASFKCLAGVVTESNMQCYTPCNNPILPRPGQCCSTCLGCKLNGQIVYDGREVTLSEDPCLKCSCSNKKLTCVKKACPVLQCPPSKQIKTPGECCPRCSEKRMITQFPGKCILGKGFHADGKRFAPDICSTCTCINGTSICRRNTCPVLECAPEFQKTKPGECCPHCPPIAEARSICTVEGKTYQNNETWNLDPCRACRCHAGEIRCAQAKCPVTKCKPNEIMVTPPGQCCAICEETAGTCTVFGDPHYKTFDGKFFSFRGSCKYQLTADCLNNTFSIRVTNDARNTRSSSWTKTVTLKMGSLKVNLGQKLRVKVNGSRVFPPYKLGDELDIQRTDDGVSVMTGIGIDLLWDGNNFLQVQAAATYKNKLCGLCGNYNNVYRDDLTSRRGINYSDDEVWRFANSWKVGGIKACSRRHENLAKTPACKHRKGFQYCRPLHRNSDMFDDCKSRLNPYHYFEACKKDMCDCPSNRCYCDNFSAYARECKRLGGHVTDNWKRETGCDDIETGLILRPQHPLRRRRKKFRLNAADELAFLTKHVPKTFLIKDSGRTPPPLH